MQDVLDLKSDMTIDKMGHVTTPASSKSQGTGGMANPLVISATNTQIPVIRTNTTSTVISPTFHSMGKPSEGANPERWV